jgi:hypothetical protein
MKSLQTSVVTSLLVGLVIIPIGCAPRNSLGTVQVSGKLTHKGQPVEGATISFIPDGEGRPATAISGTGGAYSLFTLDSPGALPGNYTVVVRKMETTTQSSQPVSMEEALKLNNRPPPPPKELLPAKYSDAAKSPLKFEVKAKQSNTIDLTLAD